MLSLPAGDHAGIVALRASRVFALVTLTVHEGRVEHLDGLVDPIKLAPIADTLGI